jgi:hypothetical protein
VVATSSRLVFPFQSSNQCTLTCFPDHCLVRGLQEPTYTDLSDRRGTSTADPQCAIQSDERLANSKLRRSNSLVNYGHDQREQLPGKVLVRWYLSSQCERRLRRGRAAIPYWVYEYNSVTTAGKPLSSRWESSGLGCQRRLASSVILLSTLSR